MEALKQLKHCITNGLAITEDDGKLILGDQAFDRQTETAFRSRRGDGKPYTLEALWFRHKLKDVAKFSDYKLRCNDENIESIRFTDIKPLMAYLEGKATEDETPHIESFAQASGPSMEGLSKSDMQQLLQPETTAAVQVDSSKWEVKDVVGREVPYSTPASVVRVHQKNFSSVLELYKIATKPGRNGQPKRQHEKRKDRDPHSVAPRKKHKESHIPIIVVPAAVTSLLNMWNAEDFLGGGLFTPTADKRKTGNKKPTLVEVKRACTSKQRDVTYHVIDNVDKIGKHDWHRVVAVFASGAQWQFKSWPYKTPAQIFHRTCGFHLHFDDEAMHPNISKWKVTVLKLSKTKRYQDRSVAMAFWKKLTEWIAARNTNLQLAI